MKHRREIPQRSEFLTDIGHRLAVAEYRQRQAAAASVWNLFRLGLCVCALVVCPVWLYACAYL